MFGIQLATTRKLLLRHAGNYWPNLFTRRPILKFVRACLIALLLIICAVLVTIVSGAVRKQDSPKRNLHHKRRLYHMFN